MSQDIRMGLTESVVLPMEMIEEKYKSKLMMNKKCSLRLPAEKSINLREQISKKKRMLEE